MGLRGPSRIPRAILAARGSPLAKNRKREPQPEVAAPDCPSWLTGEARAEWDRQVKELTAIGVLAKLDGAILAVWCETWADFLRLRKQMASKKSTGKGVAWLYKDRRDTLLKIAAQFGFTPAARARLETAVQEPYDPAEEFFRPKRN